MLRYIGTKIVHAAPAQKADNDGSVLEGYAVQYADGYRSWSTKDVFEEAYKPCNHMTFGLAIEALHAGHKVARYGWNGPGLWLELQTPDANSKMTLPYIYMSYPADARNTPGARVPWLASQTDMLARDWTIVN